MHAEMSTNYQNIRAHRHKLAPTGLSGFIFAQARKGYRLDPLRSSAGSFKPGGSCLWLRGKQLFEQWFGHLVDVAGMFEEGLYIPGYGSPVKCVQFLHDQAPPFSSCLAGKQSGFLSQRLLQKSQIRLKWRALGQIPK